VSSHEELKQLKLWQQGDVTLYTVENLEKRYANRSHKGVWYYLNLWWDTALTSSGLSADSPTMPKHVYIELCVTASTACVSQPSKRLLL
jgi:hypothetical protein